MFTETRDIKCKCDGDEYECSKYCFTCTFKKNFTASLNGVANMKETTPSKFPHESGSIFNYIETHKPVVIKSRDHHDIIMVLATDYLDMKIKSEFVTVSNPYLSSSKTPEEAEIKQLKALNVILERELDKSKDMLKKFLPEYTTYPCGDERYFNGNFEWNEEDDPLMFELIELIDSLDTTNN